MNQDTIPCTICKNPFVPIKTYSGFNQSRLCKDCRIEVESAKRRVQMQKRTEAKARAVLGGRKEEALHKMSQPNLLKTAQDEFNLFIRNRDRLPNGTFYCPTCKKFKTIKGGNYHACHFYPVGHYSALRYNENNVFGGCSACNRYKHGVGYEYADWVRQKIGEQEYQKLREIQSLWDATGGRWEKLELIEIIKKYRTLNKQYKPL